MTTDNGQRALDIIAQFLGYMDSEKRPTPEMCRVRACLRNAMATTTPTPPAESWPEPECKVGAVYTIRKDYTLQDTPIPIGTWVRYQSDDCGDAESGLVYEQHGAKKINGLSGNSVGGTITVLALPATQPKDWREDERIKVVPVKGGFSVQSGTHCLNEVTGVWHRKIPACSDAPAFMSEASARAALAACPAPPPDIAGDYAESKPKDTRLVQERNADELAALRAFRASVAALLAEGDPA